MLGVSLLVASQVFISGQLTTEEYIIGKNDVHPLYVVGVEGFWGLLEYVICLAIFQNIQCGGIMCPYGVLEDT